LPDLSPDTADALMAAIPAYGALYVAVLAGIRIGALLRIGGWRNGLALLPPFLAFVSCFAPFEPSVAALAMLVAAQGAADAWASDGARLPVWYGRLRVRTTLVAVVALVAIFFWSRAAFI
jgi:hypothetical protein